MKYYSTTHSSYILFVEKIYEYSPTQFLFRLEWTKRIVPISRTLHMGAEKKIAQNNMSLYAIAATTD